MSSDLERLQGTWTISSLEVDGEEMPDIQLENCQIVVKGSLFTSSTSASEYKGRIELDPSNKPKSFDLIFTSGPQRGVRNLGIYELTKDGWRLCLATRGEKRPNSFK